VARWRSLVGPSVGRPRRAREARRGARRRASRRPAHRS
jgi:hypothetical protein